MGTKINTAYYGTADTWRASTSWGTGAKCSKSFKNLASDSTLDLSTDADLDVSCVPWGMPLCSASAMASPLFVRTGLEHSGSTVTNYGSLDFIFSQNESKNIPLMICGYNSNGTSQSWSSGQTTARQVQSMRVIGQTKYSGNTIVSSCAVDDGSALQNGNVLENGVATYLDYQKAKIVCGDMRVVDLNSTTANSAAESFTITSVSEDTAYSNSKKYALVGFSSKLCVNNNTNTTNIYPTVAKKFDCPKHLRVYFGGPQKILQPQRNIASFGHMASTGFENMNCGYSNNTFIIDEELEQPQTASYPAKRWCSQYMNVCSKKQVFSDVSYHWEMCYKFVQNGLVTIYNINGQPLPNTTSNLGQTFTYMVIDDCISDNPIYAFKLAILHELAFLGFPIVEENSQINLEIGDNGLYLPVFDVEHMITTGKYVTGEDCAALPNSLWEDIFDDGIPDWDPEYIPPEPMPEEDDRGDLYNIGARRFFWNNLNVHLLPSANYYQFIQKLNALNMTDPDNETWRLEFKGLNPSDYIVGAYVSFVKPPKTTATTIMLGPVDLEQTEYVYDSSSNNAGFFTFGTRDVLPFYYDFRDYEPYTKIEVYLPLCGTVELETAYFMGASLKIDYYYDIYTMSCTACLYRVKQGQELLYKTVNGTIGAQIPMLAANMGAYQNQIKSLENALKQNELKLMTSTAALAAGVIAAPLTSGTSLLAAGTAALSGAAGLANSIQKQTELEYQIEHIQPSISVTGSADPQTSLCVGQLMPKLIVKRPKMLSDYEQEYYAKTIGHACCINDILGYVEGDTESPRSGLVVCSSVDTSGIIQMISESDYIAPTADEVNMIKQALSSGVIL